MFSRSVYAIANNKAPHRLWVCRIMNYASTKAPLWPIFPRIFEQWNNHYVSNYQKISLELPLSPDANHYPTDPLCKRGLIDKFLWRANENPDLFR